MQLVRVRLLFGVVGIALLLGLDTSAQQPAQEPKPVQLKAELMQIDAVVTDKNNRPVTNLRKEDFVLLENSKPQEVSFFSFVDGRHRAVPKAGEVHANRDTGPLTFAADAGMTAVFVIDDIHLSVDSFLRIRPTLLSFIDQEMSEDDQIALVTTSGGLGMLQQLGRNKSMVRRAIMRFEPKGDFYSASPFPKELTEVRAGLIVRGDKEALALVGKEIEDKGNSVTPDFLETAAETVVDTSQVLVRQTFKTLIGVIQDLEKLGGRKSLFFISDGFLSVGIGLTTLQDAERVTDAATRAGVLIYAIDPRGLLALAPGGNADVKGMRGNADISEGFIGGKTTGQQTTAVPFINIQLRVQSQEIWEAQRIMHTLAEDTGGRAYVQNLTPRILSGLFDDNSVYYVLAYYPENTERDGKFRTIDVKVKGRDDLVIRTRKGYLALPPEELARPPLEKNEAVIKAISSPVPNPEARVSLATAFLYSPPADGSSAKGKATALIAAHFDTSWVTLKEEAGRQMGEVEVNGFVYDISGKLVNGFSRTVKIQMRPRTQSLVEREGITYRGSVELPPGFYNLRLAVVDPETLKVGTANDWIEIPDMEKSKVEIGGLLQPIASTTEAERAITQEASNNTGRTAYQVLPREWGRNSTADVVAIVYSRVSPKNLRSQVSLLKNNQVVVEQPERPLPAWSRLAGSDPFRIPIGARIPLSGLPPGRYTLRVTVRGKNEKESAVREILLTIL